MSDLVPEQGSKRRSQWSSKNDTAEATEVLPDPPEPGIARNGRRGVLLALLVALVVGLVLGGVTAVSLSGRTTHTASASPTASPSPSKASPSATLVPVQGITVLHPSPSPSLSPTPTQAAAHQVTQQAQVTPSARTSTKTSSPPRRAKAAVVHHATTLTSGDGRCVQIAQAVVNGNQAKAVTCTGSSSQSWTFTSQGAILLAGTSADPKCLDLGANNGTDIGYRVQIWSCNYGGAEIWLPQPNGSLYNSSLGRCLGIADDAAGGPALAMLPCTGVASQRWQIPTS